MSVLIRAQALIGDPELVRQHRGNPEALQACMDNIPMSRAGQPEGIAVDRGVTASPPMWG